MNQQELKKLHVIHKAIDRRITQKEAADLLDLSDRQIRRIATRVSEEGDKGVIHRSRGQPSQRAFPERIKDKILRLCQDKYIGFNPTFASERIPGQAIRKAYVPPKDHSWRKFRLPGSLNFEAKEEALVGAL